jgi:antitoxin MazE
MSAKIQKWGNSLGIRIPKTVIEKTNLNENSEVEIQHKDGNIIIMPIQKKYELKCLLKEITKSNLHKEDLSTPEGNEVW